MFIILFLIILNFIKIGAIKCFVNDEDNLNATLGYDNETEAFKFNCSNTGNKDLENCLSLYGCNNDEKYIFKCVYEKDIIIDYFNKSYEKLNVPKVINDNNLCQVMNEVDNCKNCLICGTDYCNYKKLVKLREWTKLSTNKFELKSEENSEEEPVDIEVKTPYVKTTTTTSTTKTIEKTTKISSTKEVTSSKANVLETKCNFYI
uniref:Fam-c protein n=1 Tax=Meloidogyne hapla TaxID=6305 RepID=A0A1I8B6E9_MELHA